ncbi:unnamed protein product [Closterium sp. NIES-65]|nr:unnamed protein product [Closterium sp. NIES-65]
MALRVGASERERRLSGESARGAAEGAGSGVRTPCSSASQDPLSLSLSHHSLLPPLLLFPLGCLFPVPFPLCVPSYTSSVARAWHGELAAPRAARGGSSPTDLLPSKKVSTEVTRGAGQCTVRGAAVTAAAVGGKDAERGGKGGRGAVGRGADEVVMLVGSAHSSADETFMKRRKGGKLARWKEEVREAEKEKEERRRRRIGKARARQKWRVSWKVGSCAPVVHASGARQWCTPVIRRAGDSAQCRVRGSKGEAGDEYERGAWQCVPRGGRQAQGWAGDSVEWMATNGAWIRAGGVHGSGQEGRLELPVASLGGESCGGEETAQEARAVEETAQEALHSSRLSPSSVLLSSPQWPPLGFTTCLS